MGRRAKPPKGKAVTKRSPARKPPKNEGARVRDLEKRLAEALEREADALKREAEALAQLQTRDRALTEALQQQTATGEVLRVITSSTTDLQPVLDTVAESAARLCEAVDSLIFLSDGQRLVRHAFHGRRPASMSEGFPPPPDHTRDSVAGRAFLERRVVHAHDLLEMAAEFPEGYARAVASGDRTVLGVPLLREGQAIGVILIRRTEVRPFSDKHIALLQTFADQAVIAIENARLFNETKEALERQTATAEILRVIASSPTEFQPVFDTIVRTAGVVCGAVDAILWTIDGDELVVRAHHGPLAAAINARQPVLGSVAGYAVRQARVVHVDDLTEADDFPVGRDIARRLGWRTTLSAPLLREGVAIGAILIRRSEMRPFSDQQMALLQTFADQAVIAIENVRLFTELQEKNLALTEAHAQVTEAFEQQTATSEILRVISSSPTDVQPVFDAIAQRAMTLCGAQQGAVLRFDGELIHIAAVAHILPGWAEIVHRAFPRQPGLGSASARAIMTRSVVHIPDVLIEPEYELREGATRVGIRAVLSVPMVREAEVIGTITLDRTEPVPFSDDQISLLQTFADQAVIAVENVRLFTELESRTSELMRSVEQLTALGEVGRAVSSTLDLETVLSTIVSRAIQLSATDGGSVYEYDEATEEFSLRASWDLPETYVEQVRNTRPRKGEGAVGRVAETREPVQIVDISDPTAYESRVRQMLLQIGLHALLAVPLIAEERLVGALIVMRKRTGTFAAEEVALLQTFATQSALAIQNARLFRELGDKSRQLEAASQHKSEFLANMSHELRTPLNAIIGFSEILAEKMFGDINEKQTEYLQDILESGRHLLSLINDILDLSKIEAGRMELEFSEFDLPNAIENALILVRERAIRHGIRLASTIDERLGMIGGDERKVKQVLLNLLSNALKFTPEGGRIDVRAGVHDKVAEVSVTDTGVGIAPEDQEAVFEEFRQVGTADKKVEGTGLGLALSRKFIELHGGRIWVKSQVGMGSTFTFTIPELREPSGGGVTPTLVS